MSNPRVTISRKSDGMPSDNAASESGDLTVRTDSGEATLAERLLTVPHRIGNIGKRDEYLTVAANELATILDAEVSVSWQVGEPQQTKVGPECLRINERGSPLACIELRKEGEFSPEEQKLLELLAISLSHVLTRRAYQVESRLLADLSSSLPGSDSLAAAAEQGARELVEHLNALGAAIFMNTNTGFEIVASAGDWPHGDAEAHVRIADETNTAAGAVMHEGGLLACPIGRSAPARYMLIMRFPETLPYGSAHTSSVEQAARTLAPHLEERRRTEVLAQLLKLYESSPDTPTQTMYDRMLAAAIRLVPGADSGSLLVRTSVDEPFEFRAASGYDLEELSEQSVSDLEAIGWYGPDTEGWNEGRPRLIRSDETDITTFGRRSTPSLDAVSASYELIRASLCLPVLREGEVMATLNLENQHDPRALGRDSLEILQMFGAPLASLLHRQHTQDVLTHEAQTDELTGTMNRRAFRAAFERELALNRRNGRALSILMIDLTDFKSFNDTYGHDVGDHVLVTTARILQSNLRNTDFLSRWGGDEFAVLLVDSPVEDANEVAARVRQATAAVKIQGRPILLNVGCATAPDASEDGEELLAIADQRMFRDKRGRRG